MNKTVLIYSCVLLLGVFVSAISQVMLKIIAYIMFVGTTFLSIIAYKGIPLSMGPILEATSYIYVTFFGVKIFGEKLNLRKVVALGLIIFGIIVYALG